MKLKKLTVGLLAAGMMWTMGLNGLAEEAGEAADAAPAAPQAVIQDTQRLDASYTLALNAINAEDYETAKEYLEICFVYCDPAENPVIYSDLLLKRACINVIEEKNDLALLNLDAALRVNPELSDAYLVKTQVYISTGDMARAVESLEQYIGLTKDTSLYETVAQLQEAIGNPDAAQEAYAKYAEGAGAENEEALFQSGLYKMQSGKYEEAIADFEGYADDENYGAGAMYNIGVCKMSLQDFAGAVEAFSASEEKGGTFEGLYYNRGVCSMLNGDYQTGADDFARSLESEPFTDDAQFYLGVCRMQLEDYEAASTAFTILIGDDPALTANPEEEAGDQEEQAGAGEKEVNDAAYYYRALCRAALGELEGAISDFTVCIDHGYELSQSYYQRAQIYAALGKTEEQNSDLENSLKYAE